MVACGRLKTKEELRLFALKVVADYESFSPARDSVHSDLTCKRLVVWKSDCWGELVATGGSTV